MSGTARGVFNIPQRSRCPKNTADCKAFAPAVNGTGRFRCFIQAGYIFAEVEAAWILFRKAKQRNLQKRIKYAIYSFLCPATAT
jgi:hypothetical protein